MSDNWIESQIAAGRLSPGARGMTPQAAATQYNAAHALAPADPDFLVPPAERRAGRRQPADVPRVWLGCLACYNSGRLVGDWYPATDAATVTPPQLHERPIRPETHEELWVMDHEHIPVDGEMSPMEATRWGECFDELDNADLWPALCAWVRGGSYVAEGNSDLPVLSDFAERFCGTWDSFEDYARQLAEDCETFTGVPEDLRSYIDMRAWARDIEADYVTERDPSGGLFIVRSF